MKVLMDFDNETNSQISEYVGDIEEAKVNSVTRQRVVMTWTIMIGFQLDLQITTIHLAGMIIAKTLRSSKFRGINQNLKSLVLTAISALNIATKFVETFDLSVSKLAHLASGFVVDVEHEYYPEKSWVDMILKMERSILFEIHWKVHSETPASHLHMLFQTKSLVLHSSDQYRVKFVESLSAEQKCNLRNNLRKFSLNFATLALKYLSLYQEYDSYLIALASLASARAYLYVKPIWPSWIPKRNDMYSIENAFPCFARIQQYYMSEPQSLSKF